MIVSPRKRRHGVARSLLFFAALAVCGAPAAAAEWRLSTSYKPDSEAHAGSLDFAERVKAKSQGRLDIKVYPANQLGDWTEVYEQVMGAAVEMTMGAVPSTFDRRLAIDSFPYAVTDYAEAATAYAPGGTCTRSSTRSSPARASRSSVPGRSGWAAALSPRSCPSRSIPMHVRR